MNMIIHALQGGDMPHSYWVAARITIAVAVTWLGLLLTSRPWAVDHLPLWFTLGAPAAIGALIFGSWWATCAIPAAITIPILGYLFVFEMESMAQHNTVGLTLAVLFLIVSPVWVVAAALGCFVVQVVRLGLGLSDD
jgi:hypothetical protein